MNDIDKLQNEIINIIIELKSFSINELKEKIKSLDGECKLKNNIAEHILLTHPYIKNHYGIFTWTKK